jgi:xanthine dehydrogenase accessory factor
MIVLIRGGGDLASGVALRLHRAGLRVAISELAQPLAVRRMASFAEAIYTGEHTVEGITAKRVSDPGDTLKVLRIFGANQIPVMIDPEASAVGLIHPTVVVDARMGKGRLNMGNFQATLFIGLGPGFEAGKNCHAVIETRRGHNLGRVIWQGAAETDTGIPDHLGGKGAERVLRAPADGALEGLVEICAHVGPGQPIAAVAGQTVTARFAGVLRGLIHPGIAVKQGDKIGDIDSRDDPSYCTTVSDKALAIGGGVLEAILTKPNLRPLLWK